MRLPDDYEEHSSMTPMMVMSIVLVTLLVGVILVVVLLMNNKTRTPVQNTQQSQSFSSPVIEREKSQTDFAGGDKLTPDYLDFCDMYPP